MKYRCFRCDNFETIIKTHYVRHLKRKRSCPKVNNIEVGKLLEEVQNKSYTNRFKNGKLSDKYTQVSTDNTNVSTNVNIMSAKCQPNVSSNVSNVSSNVSNVSSNVSNVSSVYFCKYCNKSLKHRQSKYNHELKYCKNRHKSVVLPIKNKDLSEQNYIKALENQIYQLCQEKDEYRKQMDKLITKTDKERKDLIDKVGVTNIQININNYGKENLEYLTNEYVGQLLKLPYNAVPQLLKHIHFNPKHPENHNIKIPNKKHKFALIRKGDKWEYRNKKNIIEDMVDTGYNILDCHMDNNKTIVSDKKKQNFSEFQKKFECIPKIKKDLYLKTELEILNGQVSLENSKLNEEINEEINE